MPQGSRASRPGLRPRSVPQDQNPRTAGASVSRACRVRWRESIYYQDQNVGRLLARPGQLLGGPAAGAGPLWSAGKVVVGACGLLHLPAATAERGGGAAGRVGRGALPFEGLWVPAPAVQEELSAKASVCLHGDARGHGGGGRSSSFPLTLPCVRPSGCRREPSPGWEGRAVERGVKSKVSALGCRCAEW